MRLSLTCDTYDVLAAVGGCAGSPPIPGTGDYLILALFSQSALTTPLFLILILLIAFQSKLITDIVLISCRFLCNLNHSTQISDERLRSTVINPRYTSPITGLKRFSSAKATKNLLKTI